MDLTACYSGHIRESMGVKKAPPTFLKLPEIREENEGDRLVFECQVLSDPQAKISWFRDGAEVSQDERRSFRVETVAPDTYIVALEINEVVESDAGLYRITAKNKEGEVSSSIRLNFTREFISG